MLRLIRTGLVCFVLLLVSVSGLHAQDADALVGQATEAYRQQDFARSGELFAAAIAAGAEEPGASYNAACSFALAGRPEEAFRYLGRAIENGWTDVAHLQRDADLESLHADPRWDVLVQQAEANARQERLRWGGQAFETPYQANISTEEKVAGLSRLWAETKFNFTNFDLVPGLDWDSLYLAYLPRVTATSTTADYYQTLMEMVAQLRDGHSNVFPPRELGAYFNARPALRTRRLGEAVAVVAVYDDSLAAAGIVPGLELVAIDGMPVDDYARARVRPYQSASTEQDRQMRTYDYNLLAGAAGPLPLTFRRADGTTFQRTVRRLTPEEIGQRGIGARARPPAFQWKMLPDGVAYVALNSFGTDEAAERFAAAYDSIAQARAIVFDVRENGGGNSSVGWAILSYLTDRPFPISSWRTLEYRPAFRAWGRATRTYGETGLTYPADAAHHFTGPVAVLTSPRTFSAAEDFAVAFDAMERGLLVGEPTGGSTGQPLFFRLPGGGSARITAKRDTYPDGRDFVGVGIQPDVRASPTLEDLRAGRDAALEAALQAVRTR